MAEQLRPRPVWLSSLLWPKLRHGRVSERHLLGKFIFGAIGLLIALGIYATSVWFLRLCYEVEVVGPLLCRRLLDVVLLALLSVLVLSNIITALSSFFLAKDLDLLVVAPVHPRTLFSARLVEQLVQSSWMVLAFGLPVLLAFARVAGTPLSYGALAATLPPLLILPATLAVVLTLLLVRLLPAARVRDLIIAFAFIAFIVLYVVLRLIEPERMLNPEGFASLVNFLASFSTPSGAWLPSHWSASVIGATFRDDTGAGVPLLLLVALWTAAGSSHVVGSWVFRHVFATAYSRTQEGKRVARLSRLWGWIRGASLPGDGELRPPEGIGATADPMRVVGRLAPRGAAREFLIKDLKLLLRDASQWSQLVLLVALVFVYLYNFRHFRQIGDSGLVGRLALYLIGMALSGFVTTAVSVRFAFPLISIEGRMLWLLYSAPLGRGQILRSKLVSTLPPLLIIAEVMAIASAWILGMSAPLIVVSAVVGALTAITVSAMATGIGALLPDFRAESASKVAASFGGLVCMSASMVVAFVLLGWAAYPASLLYYGRPGGGWALVGCGLGALATTVSAVWLSMRIGARAMEHHSI